MLCIYICPCINMGEHLILCTLHLLVVADTTRQKAFLYAKQTVHHLNNVKTENDEHPNSHLFCSFLLKIESTEPSIEIVKNIVKRNVVLESCSNCGQKWWQTFPPGVYHTLLFCNCHHFPLTLKNITVQFHINSFRSVSFHHNICRMLKMENQLTLV